MHLSKKYLTLNALKFWLKNSPDPRAQWLCTHLKYWLARGLPLPLWPYRLVAGLFFTGCTLWRETFRLMWWTPLFKSQLQRAPKSLYLYSGIPYTAGDLTIYLGENCRISGQTTFTGRRVLHANNTHSPALLHIGNNVGISWQTTIAVGRHIDIGNNVRIAGRCFLAGGFNLRHKKEARTKNAVFMISLILISAPAFCWPF